MADMSAPSGQTPAVAPPVRTDDEIFPHNRWVQIGKSKCSLNLDKKQSNPIFKIAVDLLMHTNFYRAFTASTTVPSIYIQQLWDTIQYDKRAGNYRCQLDEQWFVLTKDTLREALQITPINNTQALVAPLSAEVLVDLVNQLGYPRMVRNVSNIVTNDMFQPWRALTTIINLCLTGKTSGFERPRAPEEFTQSIHTFMEDKRNLSRHTTGKKRATLILIPSIRFTKLIIHHIQRRHKFHPRPDSALHLANDKPVPGYLKFSAKGTKREVFGMPIPGRLITADIREASYYQEYQENVAKHKGFQAGEIGSTQDLPAPNPAKPARKPKSTAQKAPPKPSISTPPRSSLKSVGASEAEEVPAVEPRVADEEADYQKAVEESLKTAHAVHRDPLPPVVIREPESGKYQPPPEVPSKGKAKVTEEQVAHDLLSLQKAKKTQWNNTYSKGASSNLLDHPSMMNPLMMCLDNQTETDANTLDEGQAGSNPDERSEGQAGLDPGITRNEEQSIPNPVVHAGSDREHMDLDVTKASPQPSTEQLDEGFLATAYPKIQENLKLAVEEQVLLEEPASSSGTLSSLHHLSKNISFRDQFFSDKPLDVDKNEKTKVESMVNVPIQQATSLISISPMTSPIIDLSSRPISPKVSIAVSEVVTDVVDWAMQAPLRNRFRDLLEADMKEIFHQRMWETESYKTHKDHSLLFEALENSMNHDQSKELAQDLVEARKKKRKRRDMDPNEQAQSSDDEDIESAHIPTVNLRQGWWKPFEEKRPTTPEPARSIRSSDVPVPMNNWASALASNYSPPPEDSLLAQTGDIATFMDWFCKRRGITELKPQDLEGPAYDIVKVFHPNVIHLQYQMEECHKLLTESVDEPILRHNVSKPLPLGGPHGQVIIQSDFFFNKDLEYLRYGSKGRRPALSISKMKAAYYPDAGLEQMVPDHAVRTHMRILSVVRIKVFSMYGYDYMKKIVLRRADLNEHVIVERDFKYLYPSDFEDMYLLNLQGHLNHLPPKDKKILTTAVNQWTRQLVIRQRVEDFQPGIESYQTQKHLLLSDFEDSVMDPVTHKFNPLATQVYSSLRSPKSKRTIESRAKRSSKIISLGHDSTLLASSHNVKSKTDIKSPTHYPCVGFNSLVHSLLALSALRRSSLRTASTAAKPCQGDSSEFYLITCTIHTDQQGTVKVGCRAGSLPICKSTPPNKSQITSRGWSFASAVPGQMTYLVASLAPNSARSFVIVAVILIFVVVAIVAVIIVVTIIGVVIVVTIIGVVIVVIVGGGDEVDLTGDEDPTDEDVDTGMDDLTGVSMSLGGEIFSKEKKSRESNIGGSDNTEDRGSLWKCEMASDAKRSLVKFFRRVKRSASWVHLVHKGEFPWIQRNFLEFKTSKNRYGDNGRNDLIRGLVTKVRENRMSGGDVVDLTGDEDPIDEDRDTRMGDLTGVSVSLGGDIFSEEKKSRESNIGGSDNTRDRGGDVFDLIGDVDPTDKDGDIEMGDSTGVSASLDGEIFSGGKKCRESNIGDCDNTGDGGKIVGRAIGACGGRVTLAEEQMFSWKVNLPRLPIESNIVLL
nr:E-beta-farnesene synthase [Tanacetum cinerariifolium]